MKRTLALVFATLIPFAAAATDGSEPEEAGMIRTADDGDLSEFLWTNRPIVVFADTEADPRFQQQIDMLMAEESMLADRDVVVLTDTDPSNPSDLRKKLRPRGFQLVIIGKDGGVRLRKPFPWSVREISRSIDKMPLRQRELREQRGFN
ncbi:DUF4174 domain-containing protein [Ruegeria sp. 2205SS24-7]|uniref:DUF4174 domain-containing protein n=1 Tax=Ruegeria discodermiae TaxID=3064389 RepID=UPI0027415F41|nr:DUF4174 domain-containing protein [Ruegeria sp. 2205SS24-7]MDP5217895.1 DUF4174 domain-containing protein [Ruegeria sp. 2205SS24-7]